MIIIVESADSDADDNAAVLFLLIISLNMGHCLPGPAQ